MAGTRGKTRHTTTTGETRVETGRRTPHPSGGCCQTRKHTACRRGRGEKGTPVQCWWECKLDVASAVNRTEGPQKTKSTTMTGSSNPTAELCTKRNEAGSQTSAPHVHRQRRHARRPRDECNPGAQRQTSGYRSGLYTVGSPSALNKDIPTPGWTSRTLCSLK